MKADPRLAEYYAARASEYERIYYKPERQRDLQRLRQLVPGFFTGREVLEIACGTGYWTQFIAPVAQSVTAVDITEETLAIARAKKIPGRVDFVAADVHTLPAGPSSYTGAFAGFWWSHLRRDETRPFIETLHRLLAPGAVVVLLDNRYVEGSSTAISHFDAAGNSYQRRKLDDGSEHVVVKNFPTEAQLVADLGAQCKAVEYVALDYYWLLKYDVA